MLRRPLFALALAASFAASAPGPVIVLIGPPGGGKTTQSEFLKTTYGLPLIAAEDLVKENEAELKKRRQSGVSYADLREDPSLARYFRARIKTLDTSAGFLLDGYPATQVQAQDFEKLMNEMSLKRLLILQLNVADEEVRKRLAAAGEAADRIEQRIKDYHREFDMIRTYYPGAQIAAIDGAGTPDAVSKRIRAALKKAGVAPRK